MTLDTIIFAIQMILGMVVGAIVGVSINLIAMLCWKRFYWYDQIVAICIIAGTIVAAIWGGL